MKHLLKAIICLALIAMMVLWFIPAHAVTTERTESTLISNVKNIHAGQKFWAVVHIKLQPGWHTYWKNPGDSGISPTFSWTLPNGFSAGDIQYLAPDRLPVGPLMDYGYNNDAYYFVSITPPPILRENATAILALKAKWLVCNDVCIPETADLSLALPATAGAPEPSADAIVINDLVSKFPTPSTRAFGFSVEGNNVHFDLPMHEASASEIKDVIFFPAVEGLIANAAKPQVSIDAGKVAYSIQKADGKLLDSETGVISFFLNNGARKDYEVQLQSGAGAPVATTTGDEQSLIITVLFAFLGGLILNLMPCVFPILSLKALNVVKKASAHPDVVRFQSIAYTVGVVVSFLAMAAILIIVQKSGAVIGWGYQMQSPTFVSALAILLFIVGLNLSGYFEFPMLFGNIGSTEASHDTTLGSFLTGVLAVLVATPCTAPFMAPAIGFALTQNVAVILIVFAALGFGLAAPFLLIGLFPACVKILPKPGVWMLTFKQFLAFPMYLSSVWLVWVLMHEAGDNAAAIILISMILVTFVIWLWRHGAMLAKALSALIIIAAIVALKMALLSASSTGTPSLHAQSEPFSSTRLEALRAQNIPVFVDATADWCITCKVNETVALSSPDIMKAFSDHHIVYMVADWTHGDPSITNYLESFGRRGVPIYVYYAPKSEPQVLPQVLTESTVLKAISQ